MIRPSRPRCHIVVVYVNKVIAVGEKVGVDGLFHGASEVGWTVYFRSVKVLTSIRTNMQLIIH